MNDLVARLKTRPLPVRRRIATATAGAATLLVGVIWFTANFALGTFGSAPVNVATAPIQNQNVAGVAAAVIPAPADDSSTAGLTIVQTDTSSTLAPTAGDRTVIPF